MTPEEFNGALQKLGIGSVRPKIAVAVSGGGDSLALTVLLQAWVKANGGEMLALTVDHRLRPESTQEALDLQKLLRARGIVHEILSWQGDKPVTHVQERAREARYQLLLQACRERGFSVLAVAHNAEDQLETFWMRLAHGSGLDGLAGMAPVRDMEGVKMIRPLLSFSRAQLRAMCVDQQIQWIEDPSNQNEKYLRVKLRAFENLLVEEGLTAARLSQTLQKLDDSRQALQVMTERAAAASIQLYPEGYACLKRSVWQQEPRDIQRRLLMQALMDISPQPYPIGFEALEKTRLALLEPSFSGKTLSGCEIFSGPDGDILLVREADVVEGRVRAAEGKSWDKRFIISGFPDASCPKQIIGADTAPDKSLEVGSLGEDGISELRKNTEVLSHSDLLHFKVKRVMPALWQGQNLLAVPHLSYYSKACSPQLRAGKIFFRAGTRHS